MTISRSNMARWTLMDSVQLPLTVLGSLGRAIHKPVSCCARKKCENLMRTWHANYWVLHQRWSEGSPANEIHKSIISLYMPRWAGARLMSIAMTTRTNTRWSMTADRSPINIRSLTRQFNWAWWNKNSVKMQIKCLFKWICFSCKFNCDGHGL